MSDLLEIFRMAEFEVFGRMVAFPIPNTENPFIIGLAVLIVASAVFVHLRMPRMWRR